VLVRPGRYDELVYVPPSAPPITLRGTGEKAGDVRIGVELDARTSALEYARRFGSAFESSPVEVRTMFKAVRAQAQVGTAGSAAVWIRADGFEARNLTFANEHSRGSGDREEDGAVHSQAVAVLVDDADRVLFERVRIEGFQDTLYLRQSRPQPAKRTFVHRSVVEGDMDFIFGEATAYFLESEIRTIGARAQSYLAAPSTHVDSPYGLVFERCRFTSDGSAHAAAGRFKLARQWFRGPLAVGKMVVMHSAIGNHIERERPWADWSSPGTGRYRAVRFGSESGEPWLAEYENE
jgi:pectinesterase